MAKQEDKTMEFKLILHEKPVNEGLTRSEAIDMIDMLSDNEFLLIEIEAKQHESAAMGFISMEFADKLNYDYEGLTAFVANILDDMNNESDDCIYEFEGEKIWLTR